MSVSNKPYLAASVLAIALTTALSSAHAGLLGGGSLTGSVGLGGQVGGDMRATGAVQRRAAQATQQAEGRAAATAETAKDKAASETAPADSSNKRGLGVAGSAQGGASANAEASRSKRSLSASGGANADASAQADVKR